VPRKLLRGRAALRLAVLLPREGPLLALPGRASCRLRLWRCGCRGPWAPPALLAAACGCGAVCGGRGRGLYRRCRRGRTPPPPTSCRFLCCCMARTAAEVGRAVAAWKAAPGGARLRSGCALVANLSQNITPVAFISY
jgi:hypothetical protein